MPKKQNRTKLLRNTFFILLIIFLFNGCAMLRENARKKQEAKEALEKQKEDYLELRSDLTNKSVRPGISQEEIEEKYGEPADIFSSSSDWSQFELWTYEYPDASNDSSLRPIRLYLIDNKLSSWTN